jgi:flagellar basal body-associated protein FliL
LNYVDLETWSTKQQSNHLFIFLIVISVAILVVLLILTATYFLTKNDSKQDNRSSCTSSGLGMVKHKKFQDELQELEFEGPTSDNYI